MMSASSASIAALVLCSIKNEPIATNTHISISKYSIAVPTLSKNVRKAVKMLVKLLKMQDFHDFTLCINAMHSTCEDQGNISTV